MKLAKYLGLLGFLVVLNVVEIQGKTSKHSNNGKVETYEIEACTPGKFLWRPKSPDVFFVCLTKRPLAARMDCPPGKIMCNKGAKEFQPCMCKGTVKPSSNTYSKKDFNKFAKMAPEMSNDNDDMSTPVPRSSNSGDAFPSNGCPDPFLKQSNAHMLNGVVKDLGSLKECQYQCLMARNCIGVDWNKKTANNKKRCYLIFWPEAAAHYYKTKKHNYDPRKALPDTCCDHYRRTMCHSKEMHYTTPMPDPDKNKTKDGKSSDSHSTADSGFVSSDGPDIPYPGLRVYEKSATNMDNTMSNTNQNGGMMINSMGGSMGRPMGSMTGSMSNNMGGRMHADPPTTEIPTTTTTYAPTTTIPDSGCPYTLKEFHDSSHPFGKNITKLAPNREECKRWCLIRGFCVGVDWNEKQKTCYRIPEIIPRILKTGIPGVTHYRKVDCGRPLKCWVQPETEFSASDPSALSVTNREDTKLQHCTGLCYVKQRVKQNSQTIERGCLSRDQITVEPPSGCRPRSVNQFNVFNMMECYCDTDMCSGLSPDALSSQVMFLPLDRDISDHSGFGNTPMIPEGCSAPAFSCLDKMVNCSALFTGSQCVVVPQQKDTVLGVFKDGDQYFQATFHIHFKVTPKRGGAPPPLGFFGNSLSPDVPATWMFSTTESNTDNYIQAGILTDEKSDIVDYRYIEAVDGKWHSAIMRYNGTIDLNAGQLNELLFYLDGQLKAGNTMDDSGQIKINGQPVTIGTLMGTMFRGFIDEVRIFALALDQADMKALMVMKDKDF